LFPLFPFSNLFYLFLILSNAKVSKNKYAVEKEKNGGFGGDRENSNANGGRRVEKKMGLLPVYLPARAPHL
jgi:hypothetical protein